MRAYYHDSLEEAQETLMTGITIHKLTQAQAERINEAIKDAQEAAESSGDEHAKAHASVAHVQAGEAVKRQVIDGVEVFRIGQFTVPVEEGR